MAALAGFRQIRTTLAEPKYGVYVSGNLASLIGNWMQRIGVGWLAWELSHSGTVLGIVAFAQLFPTIVIGPFGGALADRLDRRTILMAGQTLAMVLAFILFGLTATGRITVPLLVLIVVIEGITVGFNQPARLAMVSELVERQYLPTAVAINSLVFNLARFIGPAIAGLVIVGFDIATVFLINSVSFLAFIAALWRLHLPERTAPRRSAPMLQAIGEGLRYTVAHRGIGPLLLLHAILAMSARPFVELLPGIAGEVFSRGAAGLATLSSAVGIGAIGGGLWLAQRDHRNGLADLALGSALGVALAVLLLALSPTFPVGVLAATAAGFVMVTGGVGTQTIVQTAVDEAVRGRVLSLFGLIFRSGPAIGALLMGLLSDWTGFRWPLVAGAVIGILAWFWIWQQRPRINAALQPAAAASPDGRS
jgi:MFS family permease